MDGFELNKIAATILIAGIIAMIVGNIADILYQPDKKFERGYEISVTEESSTSPTEITKEEEKIDIQALMAKADAERGKKDIKKCSVCHNFAQGEKNKVGPNLWNISGSSRGYQKNFNYSKALLAKSGVWSDEDLFNFLRNPRKFIPGTKMAFAGYKNPQDVADAIAYLKTFN